MRRLIVYLFAALLIGAIVIQNRHGVILHAFLWTVPKVSFSLVILASVLFGAVLGASFRVYGMVARRRKAKLAPVRSAP